MTWWGYVLLIFWVLSPLDLGCLDSLFSTVYLFWERATESTCAQVGEGYREGERENLNQALHCQHRAWLRAWIRNCEIMTWAEIRSQMLNPLSHPGTPVLIVLIPVFISAACWLLKTFWWSLGLYNWHLVSSLLALLLPASFCLYSCFSNSGVNSHQWPQAKTIKIILFSWFLCGFVLKLL